MDKIKKHISEQIVSLSRQIDVTVANGKKHPITNREAGNTEQTYYRWHRAYSWLQLDQARQQRLVHFPVRKANLLLAFLLFFPALMVLGQPSLPPLAPGQGRIVLYRPYHFVGGGSGNLIALNGEIVCILRAGKYFYIDQAPGIYYVHAYWLSLGILTRGASQFVSLQAGNTLYLKLNSDYNVMEAASAEQAANDLRGTHLDTAAQKAKDKQSPQRMAKVREDYENFKQSSGFTLKPVPQTTAQSAAPAENGQATTPQPASNSIAHSLFGSMRNSNQPAAQSNPVFASGQTGGESGAQQPPQPIGKMQATAGNVVLFVTVNQRCEKDHDPLGLMPGVGLHLLSKCGANELNHLREIIAQGLKNRNVAVAETNQQGSVQLAVTLTRSRWDGLNEFARGKIRFAATYLLSSAGTAPPGNVEYEESGTDKHAEERFGDKIAAEVASKIATMTQSTPAVGNPVN